MITWIKENLGILMSTIIGPAAGWFFTKRHYQNIELKKETTSVLETNLTIYQRMIDDLGERISVLSKLLYQRELEVEELKTEIELLRERVDLLEESNQKLRKDVQRNIK